VGDRSEEGAAVKRYVMRKSTLQIRDVEYDLDEVLLTFSQEDDDDPLTFDLFVDRKDLARAGFAINAMTVKGINAISRIVRILAIGVKERNRLFIGGKEIQI
jgi:hypothetical protein